MKKILIIILLFSAAISTVSAQKTRKKVKKDNPTTSVAGKNYTSQAGFNAGSFLGFGPTYRYTEGKNAFQITGLPIFSDGELFLNASLGYTRSLVQAHHVDLALIGSGGFIYTDGATLLGFGLGTQIEIKLLDALNLEARSGLSIFSSIDDTIFDDGTAVLSPSLGVALMYNFTLD